MAISISSTDVARHLGDYLARIKHRGESFIVTRNDQPLAQLTPISANRTATWRQLREALATLPIDPSFADDLEKVNAADQPLANPWG
jgi:antitoxin (DNA-binding transcriptional repressor) of toxin-antitoxin stability system